MISISRLREVLSIRPTDDDDLLVYRDEVIALFEQVTGRLWNRREDHVEEIYPANDRVRMLRLALSPVESIEVKERGGDSDDDWADVDVLDPSLYRVEKARRLRRRGGFWADEVLVTSTGGYSDGSAGAACPADIERALIVQAQFLRSRLSSEKVALRTQVVGKASSQLEEATLHPLFREVASRYRRSFA